MGGGDCEFWVGTEKWVRHVGGGYGVGCVMVVVQVVIVVVGMLRVGS